MISTSLILAAATALLSGASEAQYLNATHGTGYISYSTVTGYFLQDEPDTVASGFDYVRLHFRYTDIERSDRTADRREFRPHQPNLLRLRCWQFHPVAAICSSRRFIERQC